LVRRRLESKSVKEYRLKFSLESLFVESIVPFAITFQEAGAITLSLKEPFKSGCSKHGKTLDI